MDTSLWKLSSVPTPCFDFTTTPHRLELIGSKRSPGSDWIILALLFLKLGAESQLGIGNQVTLIARESFKKSYACVLRAARVLPLSDT